MGPFLGIGAAVGSIAVFVAIVVWFVRKVQRARADAQVELERDVMRGHAPKRLDVGPQFFGVESRGATQMRGNGTMVLTADELAFVLWIPHMTLRIPLRDIVAVDHPKSHLGKSVGVPLLRVRWRTAGVEDTVAWRVADLAGWTAAIGRPTEPHAHA
jgi:hypothetical protein